MDDLPNLIVLKLFYLKQLLKQVVPRILEEYFKFYEQASLNEFVNRVVLIHYVKRKLIEKPFVRIYLICTITVQFLLFNISL